MQLDAKASEIVLRSLREAIPSRWPAKVDELRLVCDGDPDMTLPEYLDEIRPRPRRHLRRDKSWSDLCDAAGVPSPRPDAETPLRRAIGRLLHVDDAERLATYRAAARGGQRPVERRRCPSASGACSTCSSPVWAIRR